MSYTSMISKKRKSVKRKTQKPEDIGGFKTMSEFRTELQKRSTGQKPAKKTKDGSWTIHPSQKQWREDMKGLDPVERCLLIDLNFYARADKNCWPSIGTLKNNLSIGKSTVKLHMKALVKKRLVKIKPRTGQSNLYKPEIRF